MRIRKLCGTGAALALAFVLAAAAQAIPLAAPSLEPSLFGRDGQLLVASHWSSSATGTLVVFPLTTQMHWSPWAIIIDPSLFSEPTTTPSPVPEPGTALLLAAGVAGVAWLRRR